MLIRTASVAAAIAFLIAGSAFAHDYTIGSLKIDHPWSRATPKAASVGGGYMKITNTGSVPDRLVGGSSDISSRFEIHEMSMDGGVMKMRHLPDGIEIKPGQTIEFKPGSFHAMFIGIKRPFVQGERVKATLQFEKAGKVDVDFAIAGVGVQSPAAGDHSSGGTHMKH